MPAIDGAVGAAAFPAGGKDARAVATTPGRANLQLRESAGERRKSRSDGPALEGQCPAWIPGRPGTGGGHHTLAVTRDGAVWTWGSGYYGSLGVGVQSNASLPRQVPGLTGIRFLAAGGFQSAAIGGDGSLWWWGLNSAGQLGDGTTSNRLSPVRIDIADVREVAIGANHMLVLNGDGTVWAAGIFYNHGATTNTAVFRQMDTLREIQAIAAGANSSYALSSSGTPWAWGRNYSGELGLGVTAMIVTPQPVTGVTGVRLVHAGTGHALAFRQ